MKKILIVCCLALFTMAARPSSRSAQRACSQNSRSGAHRELGLVSPLAGYSALSCKVY